MKQNIKVSKLMKILSNQDNNSQDINRKINNINS